jgi:hypothetical protein
MLEFINNNGGKTLKMKNYFLLVILVSLVSACATQRTQVSVNQTTPSNNEQMYPGHTIIVGDAVPEAVRNAFKKNHSGIKGVQWYKIDEGYVVYYPYKKMQSRISYDSTGNMIISSREVKSEDVFPVIRDYMKKKYPGIQYGKTFLTTQADGGKRYDVQVEEDKWESFDMNGKSIGESKSIDKNKQ